MRATRSATPPAAPARAPQPLPGVRLATVGALAVVGLVVAGCTPRVTHVAPPPAPRAVVADVRLGEAPADDGADQHAVAREEPDPTDVSERDLEGRWTGVVAERCRKHEVLLTSTASDFGLDAALLVGLAKVESRFDATARSRAGARGLLQVMPKTGERLGCGTLDRPGDNARCGAEVLERFLAHYDGDIILALSAYHAGYRIPNAARDGESLPSNVRYVESVLAARAQYLRHGCGG